MIKDAKVHLGTTPSDLSPRPSEVVINGVPMTIKEAAALRKKKPDYHNLPKNQRNAR